MKKEIIEKKLALSEKIAETPMNPAISRKRKKNKQKRNLNKRREVDIEADYSPLSNLEADHSALNDLQVDHLAGVSDFNTPFEEKMRRLGLVCEMESPSLGN